MGGSIAVEDRDDDFWRLWLREREYLLRMCVRWLSGDRNDAEDVLSKGAIRAALYFHGNPQRAQFFRPWMLRVLFNLCVDTRRDRQRGVAFERHAPARPVVLVGGAPEPPPDHSVLRGQLAASLEQAAAGLPPHLYQAFALRFIDELSYERISEVLSITPQNARKRIQLARRILREELRAFA